MGRRLEIVEQPGVDGDAALARLEVFFRDEDRTIGIDVAAAAGAEVEADLRCGWTRALVGL